jgi:ferritin
MNLSKTMQEAFNQQINNELFSAYLYLAMAAHCESANLPGAGRWLRVQFEEEQAHALKMFDYVIERGGQVSLKAIDAPAATWKSTLAVFEQVLQHEQQVTALVYKLYETALAENDYAAQTFIQWFISEQVEEEKNATEVVENLKRIEAHETAVLMLDHQLGKRGK